MTQPSPLSNWLTRWTTLDWVLVAIGLVAVVGMLAVQSGVHQTSGRVVQGESDIHFTVLTRNTRTMQPDMLKAGEMTHLTIRNHPRGEVPILKAEVNPTRTLMPKVGGGTEIVVDPTVPHAYDYRLVLKDHAQVTTEGYVSNGIKIKIGLPIELEGKHYRIPGVIVNVTEAPESAATDASTSANVPAAS
jgi:hypothetical protein